MKMNIRFLSKDDRQMAEGVLKSEGWDCAGTSAYLTVEINAIEEADLVQERLNAAEIDWRDMDY